MRSALVGYQRGSAAVEIIGLILGIAGLLIAILALVVGFWHVYEIRQQLAELREQTEAAKAHASALEDIRHELSTRYVGKFPDYLRDIVDVLKTADRRIVIMCDFPGYGAFTDPDTFLEYRQTLEKKLETGVEVQFASYDHAKRIRHTRAQFTMPLAEWKGWKREPHNAERLRRLLTNLGSPLARERLTQEQFLKFLDQYDSRILDGSLKPAKRQEVSSHIPVYLWLADHDLAVFAVPSFSEVGVEHGFRTSDEKLITVLEEIRQRTLDADLPDTQSR